MVDRRKSLHNEVIASTREHFPQLLATEVPYWSEIERMSLRRAPLPAYAPRSAAAQIYSALWREIEARMGQGASTAATSVAIPVTPSDAGLNAHTDDRIDSESTTPQATP